MMHASDPSLTRSIYGIVLLRNGHYPDHFPADIIENRHSNGHHSKRAIDWGSEHEARVSDSNYECKTEIFPCQAKEQ